ncbi:unnamed protein product [marine sediment metagenome]|uniref:Uncharacterized protein n=1 Tax=marine sediment metagenome TaxID=412755 RepID=X1RXD4_9ZZZZ
MKERKSHGIQLLLRAVVRDPDGKIISDTGEKPARSFVIQFLEFFYGLFRGITVNATQTDGGEGYIYRNINSCDIHLVVDAGVGVSKNGVVVGTGDTPATNIDNKLETQLTEGVTAGKISHGAVVITAAAVVGANVDLTITRAFTNNTGSNIIVKEAGLYCIWSTAQQHCLVRDVLGTPVETPDKCSLTVIYTVRTTV